MAWSFEDPPLLGPRGLVGVPPARFVEAIPVSIGHANTRIRLTQTGVEAWAQNDSSGTYLRITQLGVEAWIQNPLSPSRTFDLPPNHMGPVGFLGVRPRT